MISIFYGTPGLMSIPKTSFTPNLAQTPKKKCYKKNLNEVQHKHEKNKNKNNSSRVKA